MLVFFFCQTPQKSLWGLLSAALIGLGLFSLNVSGRILSAGDNSLLAVNLRAGLYFLLINERQDYVSSDTNISVTQQDMASHGFPSYVLSCFSSS